MSKHNAVKASVESKKIKLIDVNRMKDGRLQIENIHTQETDYMAVCNKENKEFSQWFSMSKELIPKLSNTISMTDVYISNNSFYTTCRQLKFLKTLNCFWIDLDYYKVKLLENKTPEQVIAILRKKGLFKYLEPSFFMYSGNGLYIYYLIKNASAKACLPIWQVIEKQLTELFEEYGADRKSIDAVHILRLCGSINSKTGNTARFIYNSDKEFRFEQEKEEIRRYTLDQMCKAFLPELPYSKEEYVKYKDEQKAKKAKKIKMTKKEQKKKKITAFYNLYNLNWARLQDLRKLVELRNGECEGIREFMCFLYRYWSCYYLKNIEKALEETLSFNKEFKKPLLESEVIKATKRAEKAYEILEEKLKEYFELEKKPSVYKFFLNTGCYVYSNDTLIKELEIKQEEMIYLLTIINTKEKNRRNKDYRNEWLKNYRKENRRNNEGLTAREQAKQEKINQIIELVNKGVKQIEIAEKLGIAKSLVSMYIKEIKEMKRNESKNNENVEKIEMFDYLQTIDNSELEAII